MIENFNIKSVKRLRVLVAPLDWGLGHATRCIPLIKYLDVIGCDVIIAAEGMQQALLQAEMPHLQFVILPGYRITFGRNERNTIFKIFLQIPKILIAINSENRWLKQFLLRKKVDLIISDNRYGLVSKELPSVFITHQLTIKTPFRGLWESILRKINYYYINKYSECWVPDFEGAENMGGELSHPARMPSNATSYLGRLSRIVTEQSASKNLHVLIILSGPEPQRSIFEKKLLDQLQLLPGKAILVRGLPGEVRLLNHNRKDLVIFNHLPATALNEAVNNAEMIISRSGYSTVMDLIGFKKKCIFVPTPGQAEQEYLARYLASGKYCLAYRQKDFNLQNAVLEARSFAFKGFKQHNNPSYQDVISTMIRKLENGQ